MKSLMLMASLLTLVSLVSGCATSRPRARDAGRQGFFDQLSAMDRPGRGARGAARDKPPADDDQVARTTAQAELPPAARKLGLSWPLASIEVTSSFGGRGRDFHEGIDLRAKVGTPVYAAQDGIVLYAGQKISGYGKLVVIRHAGGVSTVYAHNSRLLVVRGSKVRKGQRVAISGQTGRVSGPHVHFEVRHGVMAIDPLKLLPSPTLASLSQVEREPAFQDASRKSARRAAERASAPPTPASRARHLASRRP